MTSLHEIVADGALSHVLRSFKEATGIAARVVSPDGGPALAPTAWEDCSLCALVRTSVEGQCRCAQSYARAAQQASSIGEPCIFQCHAGLICWAAPLMAGSELLGSILCGQVIMWDSDDLFVDEVMQRTRSGHLPKPNPIGRAPTGAGLAEAGAVGCGVAFCHGDIHSPIRGPRPQAAQRDIPTAASAGRGDPGAQASRKGTERRATCAQHVLTPAGARTDEHSAVRSPR